MAPKDVHVLIIRTCDSVTFHGKRGSADASKVKDLELR